MPVPHLTIEYSANVADHHDVQRLVDVVHEAALDDGLPPLDGLRTRAVARDHYRIADGQSDHAFVAITARIGPGRDAASKHRFVKAVLAAAHDHIADQGGPLAIAWSIELIEIDPEFRINRNEVRERLNRQLRDQDD